jgi:ATP-binding cassette subfamily B protein
VTILAHGAGGLVHAGMLVAWIVLVLLMGRGQLRIRGRWAWHRLELTDRLVEVLVGHRTRTVQQPRERWHVDEDARLDELIEVSRALDVSAARLIVSAPQGWAAVGLAGLLPAFVAGVASPASLGIGVGGVLLAHASFARFAEGIRQLCDATLAYRRVDALLVAARRPSHEPGAVRLRPSALEEPAGSEGEPLLELVDGSFRYPRGSQPVLRRCGLSVRRGEHLLLEGESGCGKSTLAAVLAGLRELDSGLLLARGLDRRTLGQDQWHRIVTLVPQFHDNHVFTATLAFNLLLARRWPPTLADLAEATELCHELGLGELLQRMPMGIEQPVGEAGWRLSHGERHRVFLARAILQEPLIIIFDESFSALDAETQALAMAAARQRVETIVVIAHV